MSLIKNDYPIYDWEWRNVFIKLSNAIGECQNPTVAQIRDMQKCEDHLIMRKNNYPLKHKVGKKEYLFYLDGLNHLHFKTYEGEQYIDKYGNRYYD